MMLPCVIKVRVALFSAFRVFMLYITLNTLPSFLQSIVFQAHQLLLLRYCYLYSNVHLQIVTAALRRSHLAERIENCAVLGRDDEATKGHGSLLKMGRPRRR